MSSNAKLSRRRFLQSAAFAGGGVYLMEWGWACKDEPPKKPIPAPVLVEPLTSSHRTFTDEEFANITAAVDRVLPKDQDPGAVEAGVPEYFDRAFQNPDLHKMRQDFTSGLAALERASKRRYKVSFSKAAPAEQDELLKHWATMPAPSGEAHFYETLVTFTLEGFLGDPVYGGNQHRVGWAMVGFDPGPPMPAKAEGDVPQMMEMSKKAN